MVIRVHRRGRSIEVLRAGVGLAPVLARRIMVPAPVHGEAITPDGHYLLAASAPAPWWSGWAGPSGTGSLARAP